MSESPTILPNRRAAALERERERKMAASAHAYVRGSTRRFYEWLDASDRSDAAGRP